MTLVFTNGAMRPLLVQPESRAIRKLSFNADSVDRGPEVGFEDIAADLRETRFLANFRVADQPEIIPFVDISAFSVTDRSLP